MITAKLGGAVVSDDDSVAGVALLVSFSLPSHRRSPTLENGLQIYARYWRQPAIAPW
ncbi:MAG: hypothetical protein AAF827_14550 [Cyanobacteria bacterium P01_D01_bin.6]